MGRFAPLPEITKITINHTKKSLPQTPLSAIPTVYPNAPRVERSAPYTTTKTSTYF